MIKRFLGKPVEVARFRSRKRRITRFLYDGEKATAMQQSAEWATAKAKSLKLIATRNANAEAAKVGAKSSIDASKAAKTARLRAISATYDSWQDALPLACEYMFSLNRLAKQASYHSSAIYHKKNRLIEILYQNGYCTECIIHTSRLPPKECFGCGGTGIYGYGDDCWRCDGTGNYLPAKNVYFVAFRFGVGGKTYSWHQPKENVRFPYLATGDPVLYELPTEPKEVPLPLAQVSEALELLDWVFDAEKLARVQQAA